MLKLRFLISHGNSEGFITKLKLVVLAMLISWD